MSVYDQFSQYVTEIVSFSSELTNQENSVNNIKGKPKFSSYGKRTNAWSPSRYNQDEYVEVKFEKPVFAVGFKIYENYNAGAVIKVEVFHENTYIELWSRRRPRLLNTNRYQPFTITFPKPNIRSNQYKITLHSCKEDDYSQLDSIECVGTLTYLYTNDKKLTDDIPKLLFDKQYCDLEILFANENITVTAHKSIFFVRCPQLLDFLMNNKMNLSEITSAQFQIIMEYLYTDRLNNVKLDDLIEEEKYQAKLKVDLNNNIDKTTTNNEEASVSSSAEASSSTTSSSEASTLQPISTNETALQRCISSKNMFEGEKWELVINKLIRFSAKYKLIALEGLLKYHLSTSYLTVNNVLNIFVDSMTGNVDATKLTINDEIFNTELSTISIDIIQTVCMDFINANLQKILESEKIKSLPKDYLLMILSYVSSAKR